MANPTYIIFNYPDKVAGSSGFAIYGLLRRDSDDYIYDVGDTAFEAIGTWNNARAGECDIALTWKNAGRYKATFPTVAVGNYTMQLRLRAGGSPAISDVILGSMNIDGEAGNLTFIKNVIEGDAEIDKTGSPYQLVIKIKSTDTELIRKDLNDIDGNDITTEAVVIGQHKEP